MTRDSFGKKHRVFREGWMKRQKFLFIFVVLGARIWQKSRGTIPPKLGTNGGGYGHTSHIWHRGGSTSRIFFFRKYAAIFGVQGKTRSMKHAFLGCGFRDVSREGTLGVYFLSFFSPIWGTAPWPFRKFDIIWGLREFLVSGDLGKIFRFF